MADEDTFGTGDWLRLLLAITLFLLFVKWPQPVLAIALLAIGGVMIAFNAMVFWLTLVRKGDAPAIGVVVLPIAGSWKWAWILLAFDGSWLPMLLYYGVYRRAK
jgi:hypothetical protein